MPAERRSIGRSELPQSSSASAVRRRHRREFARRSGRHFRGSPARSGRRRRGFALQEGLGVLAALAEALAVVGEPGAGLFDDAGLDAEIDQFADLGNALAIHDVELDLLERRRDLVLDDLDAGLVADDLLAILDRADAADVEADGGIEFQRIAAGRGFRASRTSRRSSCGSG